MNTWLFLLHVVGIGLALGFGFRIGWEVAHVASNLLEAVVYFLIDFVSGFIRGWKLARHDR